MPTTLIYRVNGKAWETVGPKLYKALKASTGKIGHEVSKLTYEEFESYFDDEGMAMFDQFEVRSTAPEDDHWVP